MVPTTYSSLQGLFHLWPQKQCADFVVGEVTISTLACRVFCNGVSHCTRKLRGRRCVVQCGVPCRRIFRFVAFVVFSPRRSSLSLMGASGWGGNARFSPLPATASSDFRWHVYERTRRELRVPMTGLLRCRVLGATVGNRPLRWARGNAQIVVQIRCDICLFFSLFPRKCSYVTV